MMTISAKSAGPTRTGRHFPQAAPESLAAARPRLDWLLKEVARRASAATPAVLNIGVSDGYFETQAQVRKWTIHWLAPDADTAARLVEKGVAAQVGLIQQIPLPSHSVEFVVASEVLQRLTDDEQLAGLAEMARVLGESGWLLGTVPDREILADQQAVCPCCGEVFHRFGHRRSFDYDSIREQLSPWFDIEVLGRTAFVPWRGRGLAGALKSAVRLVLAKFGEPTAFPTLYWIAKKARTPAALSLRPAAAPA